MTRLAIEGLSVAYGRRPVLRDVTVPALLPGTVTALLGPNASGKSTLLRSIAGLKRPNAGRILLDGKPIEGTTLAERTRLVRYVPQVYASAARLTVFDAVLVAARAAGASGGAGTVAARVEAILARTRIAHLAQRMISDLSGGQQQLVALAQGLVQPAPVLLFDEPTSALDLRHQLEALALLRGVALTDGRVAVVALHDLSLAARHADRVLLMSQGQVVADGTPGEVFSDPVCGRTYGVDLVAETSRRGTLMIDAALP
ncbi:ABC transporter ATP-binding protein [Roseomonas terrae]|uniref:ABC transporter ATP-binding protein n=1 Tax=Neoroseomonas terrae TaxID=424799 RepID=A0ABS5EP44_9PROT|nr:ABC transporter ATP-binding protein [Neoroseomonas terrae]MBR0652777.1 ABC transporter ATP-binding protein [Neoroseomonas terrae]